MKKFKEEENVFGKDVKINGGPSYFMCEKGYTGDVSFTEKGVTSLVDLAGGESTRFIGSHAKSILVKMKNTSSMEKLFGSNHKLTSKYPGYKSTGDVLVHLSRCGKAYISQVEAKAYGGDYGSWKVLIPNAGSANNLADKSIISSPDETSSESKGYFLATTQQEAESIKSWLNTTPIKFLMCLDQPSHHADAPLFRRVPVCPDLSKTWTDTDIKVLFSLTDDEIQWMQSCIQDFSIYEC
jgi:hypothetical protein